MRGAAEPVLAAHHVYGSVGGYGTVLVDPALEPARAELEATADDLLSLATSRAPMSCFPLASGAPCASRCASDGADEAGRPRLRVQTVAFVGAPPGSCALRAPDEAFVAAAGAARTYVAADGLRPRPERATLERLAAWGDTGLALLDRLLRGGEGVWIRGHPSDAHALVCDLLPLVPPEDRAGLAFLPAGAGWSGRGTRTAWFAPPEASSRWLPPGTATLDLATGRAWPEAAPEAHTRLMRDLLRARRWDALTAFADLADRYPGSRSTTPASREAFVRAFAAAGRWVTAEGVPVLEEDAFDAWTEALPGLHGSGRRGLLEEVLEGLGAVAVDGARRTALVRTLTQLTDDPFERRALASYAGL